MHELDVPQVEEFPEVLLPPASHNDPSLRVNSHHVRTVPFFGLVSNQTKEITGADLMGWEYKPSKSEWRSRFASKRTLVQFA